MSRVSCASSPEGRSTPWAQKKPLARAPETLCGGGVRGAVALPGEEALASARNSSKLLKAA
eukprot:6467113-Alexandrium_andersonii.AAC.1